MKDKRSKMGICMVLLLCALMQNINHDYFIHRSSEVKAASKKIDADIAKFPESYQAALIKLKEEHPNWTFQKVNIDISWDTIIENESTEAVNTITSDVPNGGKSGTYSAPLSYLSIESEDYNAYEDSYKVMDSPNRYTPNGQVIGYYMDPRNFLTEEQIFQFESLKYASSQTIQGVRQILKGTFMKGNYSYISEGEKLTKNYAATFCTAGKKYKVNPYFLAIRVRQEVGTVVSPSTSGTYNGYKGYYNFYNIGAADSGSGTAVVKGLRFAKSKGEYGRPWSSQYKAILGGAQYIYKNYIALQQNTFYFQKFSVVKKEYLYWHQYMSNIEGAKLEAKKMYDMYNLKGLLDQEITFRIPVYEDMPETAVNLPKSEGSSNNYMKTITVTAGKKKTSLITSKNYKKIVFCVSVPNVIEKVKVTGTLCNKNAKVIGCKSYVLTAGKIRTVTLRVTAENGAVRKCKVKIKRLVKE